MGGGGILDRRIPTFYRSAAHYSAVQWSVHYRAAHYTAALMVVAAIWSREQAAAGDDGAAIAIY